MSIDPYKTRWSLIERLGGADAEAWNTFVRIYVKLIRSQARKLGLSAHDADDVCQDVLLVVRNKAAAEGFTRDGGMFRSWLCVTTRNTIQNVTRKNGKLPTGTGALLDGVAGRVVGGRAVETDLAAELEKALEAEWDYQTFIEALDQTEKETSPKAWRAFVMTRRTTVTGPGDEQIHEWHTRAVPGSSERAAAELGWTTRRVHNETNKVSSKLITRSLNRATPAVCHRDEPAGRALPVR